MPFVWSIGTIFGPAIAALTSNSSLFPTLPYLLPHLICAGLLLLSTVTGYFFLGETLQTQWSDEAQDIRAETESILAVGGTSTDAGADLRGESYGTFNQVSIQEEQLWKVRSNGVVRPASLSSAKERSFPPRIIILVLCLGLYCYHSMGCNDLLPIFAQEERMPSASGSISLNGGLGLSTQQVGVILSVNGVIALFIQGVLFPALAGWFGVWRLFQVVVLLFPVPYFLFPFLVMVPTTALMPSLYAVLVLWNIFNILLYPLVLIQIKEACNPKYLGKVNGLAASVGAVARCLSPPVCGVIYSLGYRMGFSGLAWWATGLVAIVGAVQLPWIERQKNKSASVHAPFENAEVEPKEVVHILVEEAEP